MPLVVHILEEDLAAWELSHAGEKIYPRSGKLYHYRLRLGPGISQEMAEQIQVITPAPLKDLVDQDLVCFVNIEKGWMFRKIGAHSELKFQLKRPSEELRGQRRLRLRIKSIDTSSRPPRVMLEEFKR
jgi:hypothetical protein